MTVKHRYAVILVVMLLALAAGRTDAGSLPAAGAASPVSPLPSGTFNLGINYPGASLRYFAADGRALELLGQSQGKVFVGGLRYYHYPAGLAGGGFAPYLAGEADYVSFKGEYSKGTGIGGGLFGGAEYFLGRRVSVQTDLGALYMSIQDKDTALGESGFEFVLNIGFNLYFGGGKP